MHFTHELPYDVKFASDFNITDAFSFKYSQPGQPTVDYVGTREPLRPVVGRGHAEVALELADKPTKGRSTSTATIYYTSSIKMYAVDYLGPNACASEAFFGVVPSCVSGSFVDVDLSGSYQINDKVQVYANIDNLMDAKPPFDPLDYAGINYNPTYARGWHRRPLSQVRHPGEVLTPGCGPSGPGVSMIRVRSCTGTPLPGLPGRRFLCGAAHLAPSAPLFRLRRSIRG